MAGIGLDWRRQTDRQAIKAQHDMYDGEEYCGKHRRDFYQIQNSEVDFIQSIHYRKPPRSKDRVSRQGVLFLEFYREE